MKIVYLGNYVQDENLSGPEKVAKRLFQEAYSNNYDCTFLEYFFKEYSDSNLYNRLFGFKIIVEKPLVIRAGILPCIIFLVRSKCEIIHIATFKRYIIIILILSLLFQSKIVSTLHGIIKFEIRVARNKQSYWGILKDNILEKLVFNRSDLLFFLSDKQMELAKKNYKFNENKALVFPNGIDSSFKNKKVSFKKSKLLKIVYYNGYSHEVKGSKLFLEVLSNLKYKELDFELYLIGDKPLQEINEKIKVNYVPYIHSSELSDFLTDMDIYVNTAFYEPFSLMAVEAMASGLIVVVSSNVGMSRYIEHGKNGFIFDYDLQVQLESILESILTDKLDLNSISNNANLIYNQLNWKEVANMYFKSFSELLLKYS